jgi:hypothetical protein
VTVAEVLPALHARLDELFVSTLLAKVGDIESVLLTTVGAIVFTGLLELVVVGAAAGAHELTTRMLIIITKLKIFFWFITFLHLFVRLNGVYRFDIGSL